MPEQTSSTIVIDAAAADVMAVIVDFEDYPAWVQGMKRVTVTERDDQGRASHVRFELEATPIKDEYTLVYQYVSPETLRWHLAEGRILRSMEGSYEIRESAGRSEVTYKLAVEVSIPMIGLLRRKAEKVIIDTALKGLKKRVESIR